MTHNFPENGFHTWWLLLAWTSLSSSLYSSSPLGVGTNYKNNIGDTRTLQPGKKVFNTMRHRSSETVQRSGDFQSIVSNIKIQVKIK